MDKLADHIDAVCAELALGAHITRRDAAAQHGVHFKEVDGCVAAAHGQIPRASAARKSMGRRILAAEAAGRKASFADPDKGKIFAHYAYQRWQRHIDKHEDTQQALTLANPVIAAQSIIDTLLEVNAAVKGE